MPLTHILLHFPALAERFCRRRFASFGRDASVRPGAYVITPSAVALGDGVILRPGTMIFATAVAGAPSPQVDIRSGALIGSSVHIYVSNHNFADPNLPVIAQGHSEVQPVRIEEGAWIGAMSVILPGVTVGQNAVVGAHSVVTRSVPAGARVAGNPARPLPKSAGRARA